MKHNRSISLKTRVRYEGWAQTFDRRADQGAEKLPEPHFWGTMSLLFPKVIAKKKRAA
jgi:hypothetical protein